MTVLIPQRTTRTGDAATPPSLWIKLCAAFYVCSTFVIAGLMAKNNPRDLIATGATFLLGGLLWLVTQRTFGRSSSL
jgi:hypothetical protein